MSHRGGPQTYPLPYINQTASRSVLCDPGSSNRVLYDNLVGWDGVGHGREIQEGGAYVYLWLIHVDIWQKPTQYYQGITRQLKINK